MKKKALGAAVLALALAVTPLAASAAGSSSGGGSDSDYNPTKSTTTTQQAASTSSKTSAAGLSIVDVAAVASSAPTAAAALASNAATGVAPAFATGAAETAGLPAATVAEINSINAGTSIETVLGSAFAGYNTLTKTSAVVAKDATTGAIADKPTAVAVEVPNLAANATVQVAFFNNLTGQWMVLPVVVEGKIASFTAPCSGTFAFIYK